MGPVEGSGDGLVSLEEINAAAERIRGVAIRTPLLPFPRFQRRSVAISG